jgi:hypothetical protein
VPGSIVFLALDIVAMVPVTFGSVSVRTPVERTIDALNFYLVARRLLEREDSDTTSDDIEVLHVPEQLVGHDGHAWKWIASGVGIEV